MTSRHRFIGVAVGLLAATPSLLPFGHEGPVSVIEPPLIAAK
jgi:hypothetical protein